MSTGDRLGTAPREPATAAARGGFSRQRFGNVIASELLRIRTLRSSWIGVLAAAALPILLTLGDVLTSDEPSRIDLAYRVGQSLFPSIVITVAVATTFVTSEFATGMLRITYANTPRRRMVVDARVLTSVAYIVGVVWVCAVLAFAIGVVLVAVQGGTPSMTTEGVTAVAMAGLVAALYLLIGQAVAFLWRSTPAVSSFVAIYPFVESILVDVLRQTRWHEVAQWFPLSAGWNAAMDVTPPPGIDFDHLGRPWGLLYLTAWAVALILLARARELRGGE